MNFATGEEGQMYNGIGKKPGESWFFSCFSIQTDFFPYISAREKIFQFFDYIMLRQSKSIISSSRYFYDVLIRQDARL